MTEQLFTWGDPPPGRPSSEDAKRAPQPIAPLPHALPPNSHAFANRSAHQNFERSTDILRVVKIVVGMMPDVQ